MAVNINIGYDGDRAFSADIFFHVMSYHIISVYGGFGVISCSRPSLFCSFTTQPQVISVALCIALAAAAAGQERCDWVRMKTIVNSLHAWVSQRKEGTESGRVGEFSGRLSLL